MSFEIQPIKPKRRRKPRPRVPRSDKPAQWPPTDTMETMTLDHEHSHPNWVGKHPTGTHKYFDSLGEFVSYVDSVTENHIKQYGIEGAHCNEARKHGSSAHWDMNTSYAKALELARTGWPEGAAKVEELLDKVEAETRQYLPEQRQAVVSTMAEGSFCTPAYLAGHPMLFRKVKRVAATCRTVTLHAEISLSCNVDSQTQMRKGIAIAAIVQALERRRVRCEVVITSTSRSMADTIYGDPQGSAAIKLKGASERIALDDLAFALAHPAMQRRMGFAYMETVGYRLGGRATSYYGYPTTEKWTDDAITIGSEAFCTDEQMQAYVKEQLDRILGEPR